ncbi:hypothetical protein TNCV_271971 [Trichonephila clavipes]|nr:hypothetical protein TNCV_271971 [Trichonephila clavipes]
MHAFAAGTILSTATTATHTTIDRCFQFWGKRTPNRKVAARGLLTTDHVILNHGQVTWTTPELAPLSPNYHTTPTGGRFSSR